MLGNYSEMKWVAVVFIPCLLIGFLVWFNCSSGFIPESKEAETVGTLGPLSDVAVRLFVKGKVDISKFNTLEEMVSVAIEKNWLEKENEFSYCHDAWERPFRWCVKKNAELTVIRIISDGANGINEGGEGDDLYVEIRIPKQGEPTTFLKKY
jgi:hypothetical protein